MSMAKVFIIGPYQSDPPAGVRNAIAAADWLIDLGLVPVIPHLTLYWDIVSPKPRECWLWYAQALLRGCDFALRLPGKSDGGDIEQWLAKYRRIPVFHSISALWATIHGWHGYECSMCQRWVVSDEPAKQVERFAIYESGVSAGEILLCPRCFARWGTDLEKLLTISNDIALTPFGPIATGRMEDFEKAFRPEQIGPT